MGWTSSQTFTQFPDASSSLLTMGAVKGRKAGEKKKECQ
jgi:hypothetical protein